MKNPALLLSIFTLIIFSCNIRHDIYNIDTPQYASKVLSCDSIDSINWRSVEIYNMRSWEQIRELGKHPNITSDGEWSLKIDNRKKVKSIKDLDSNTINIIKQDIASRNNCVGLVYCWDSSGIEAPGFQDWINDGELYYLTLEKIINK